VFSRPGRDTPEPATRPDDRSYRSRKVQERGRDALGSVVAIRQEAKKHDTPARPLPAVPRRARSVDPRRNWANALALAVALVIVVGAILLAAT
jgi:hypothetical protein